MSFRALVALVIITEMCAALWLTFRRAQTTFDVSVSTQRVFLITSSSLPPTWSLHNVEVGIGTDDAFRLTRATLTPAASARVVFRRIGGGPLTIQIEADERAGKLSSEDRKSIPPLSHTLTLTFHNVKRRAENGESFVFPFRDQAKISVGSVVQARQDEDILMLKKGHVSITETSFLTPSRYVASEVELTAGDQFTIAEQEGGVFGFVSADDQSDLNASYRANGRMAVVVRSDGIGRHDVGLSALDRVRSDATVQAAWTIFGAAIGTFKLLDALRRKAEDKMQRRGDES